MCMEARDLWFSRKGFSCLSVPRCVSREDQGWEASATLTGDCVLWRILRMRGSYCTGFPREPGPLLQRLCSLRETEAEDPIKQELNNQPA